MAPLRAAFEDTCISFPVPESNRFQMTHDALLDVIKYHVDRSLRSLRRLWGLATEASEGGAQMSHFLTARFTEIHKILLIQELPGSGSHLMAMVAHL